MGWLGLGRAVAWVSIGCAGVLALGCSSEETTRRASTCESGEREVCIGANACFGVRTCEVGRFGSCQCTEGGFGGGPGSQVSGVGGAAGGGAGGAGPTLDPANGELGSRCDTNQDCDDGMICLTPEQTGTPLGMCSYDCRNNEEACGDSARCLQYGALNFYCFKECTVGVPGGCNGRPEMPCAVFNSNDGEQFEICVPTCRTHDDCPEARFCNISTGTCTPQKYSGPNVGTPCALNNPPAGCNCIRVLGLPANEGVCAGVCPLSSFGDLDACDQAGPLTENPAVCGINAGAAAGNPRTPGVSDYGYCTELCNCNADCASELSCVPSAVGADAGFAGVCSQPDVTGIPLCP